jgi:formyltetrahydrofolate hydrolase
MTIWMKAHHHAGRDSCGSHYTAEDMMRAGRDVEKNVLSRALYQVLAQRVFVYGNRTIIL